MVKTSGIIQHHNRRPAGTGGRKITQHNNNTIKKQVQQKFTAKSSTEIVNESIKRRRCGLSEP